MITELPFRCLSELFTALFYAHAGNRFRLVVSPFLDVLGQNLILSRFVEPAAFTQDFKDDIISYENKIEMLSWLNSLTPNTIYPETIYAVQDRSLIRDIGNKFRAKSFRDIFVPEKKDILNAGYELRSSKVLRSAPGYRVNYSRLVFTILRTLKGMGIEIGYGDLDYDKTESFAEYRPLNSRTMTMFRIESKNSPTTQKSMYICDGVWIFHRCNDCYIVAEGDRADIETVFESTFVKSPFNKSMVLETRVFNMGFKEGNDYPLEACGDVRNSMANFHLVFGGEKLPEIDYSSLRLDGCDFEFSPSRADVVGYADYCYDLIKQLHIDVSAFRNAVFDVGTHIEEIIDDAYNIYNEHRNGQKAFDEALHKWLCGEKAMLGLK